MGARGSCLGSAWNRVGIRRSPVRQHSTGWGFPIPAETDSEAVTAVATQMRHSTEALRSGEAFR